MNGYISQEAALHVSKRLDFKPSESGMAPVTETVTVDSRDDGEEILSRSFASDDVSGSGGESPNSSAVAPRRTPPKHHHHRSSQQMPQWNKVHFELVQGEHERKMERLKKLEEEVSRLRKEKAFEQSKLLMKRGNWLVQLEGLKDDRAFLLKKKHRLETTLLELEERTSMVASM